MKGRAPSFVLFIANPFPQLGGFGCFSYFFLCVDVGCFLQGDIYPLTESILGGFWGSFPTWKGLPLFQNDE